MRAQILLIALLVAASGCSKRAEHTVLPSTVVLPPRLDSYFEQYCDYTGGLGIGFDASHTYDYRFRQHLKETHDPELKRLFVLQHLHRDVEFALADFKAGIVRTGKTASRPLTFSEWQAARQRIVGQIEDLATYVAFTNFMVVARNPFAPDEPAVDASWIEELREKVRSITNAPAISENHEDALQREKLFQRFAAEMQSSISQAQTNGLFANWAEIGMSATDTNAMRFAFDMMLVHPSFGLGWDEIPPPTLWGSNAMATIEAFVAANGWNMHTNQPVVLFATRDAPISGLPWEAIKTREFPAVTHDGILYVILSGLGPESSGLAYNPKTNAFPETINGFKSIGDHWYVWKQTMTPRRAEEMKYEGQR